MRQALALALALLSAGPALAGKERPAGLEGVTFEPLLKEQIPPDLAFRDERGRAVRLGDYFDGTRPVVLVLVQYRCPMLCNLVLNGLTDGMRQLAGREGFRVGEHFAVVTVSFDHRETPALAAEKKTAYVESYGLPGTAGGWHFLTGDRAAIATLAEKAGFTFRYDAKKDEYAHAAGILVLTPKGRVSRFFPGIAYRTRDLYYGLVEASEYRIGQPVTDRLVLLFCYSYDPVRGTYQFTVLNIVRLCGAVTVVGLGVFLVLMLRREPSMPAPVALAEGARRNPE